MKPRQPHTFQTNNPESSLRRQAIIRNALAYDGLSSPSKIEDRSRSHKFEVRASSESAGEVEEVIVFRRRESQEAFIFFLIRIIRNIS